MYTGALKRMCVVGLAAVVTGADAMMVGFSSPSVPHGSLDSIPQDTAFMDTLREVTVMGDSLKVAPVKGAIDESLKRHAQPSVPTLGEVLNKVAPNAMDYVLHPFGFAERKKKKKVKKVRRILEEYDRVDAAQGEFNHKLDSILRLEGLK